MNSTCQPGAVGRAATRRRRSAGGLPARDDLQFRESIVNIRILGRTLAASAVLVAAPALAEQYGPLDVVGFAKEEFTVCDNCSSILANPSTFDPRGVLNPPDPMVNQPGDPHRSSSNLGLAMLSLGLSHEFDNAVKIQALATGRERNNEADVFGNYLIDLYAGISHPQWGSLAVGKFSTRSWTRADSFAYPMGLSTAWAESGAGYGVLPQGIRYAHRAVEIGLGKVSFEATFGTAGKREPLNAASSVVAPPQPQMLELFVQYSNEKNLIELTYQQSSGGIQSSFAKGAFYGAQGDTNGPVGKDGYSVPYEDVFIAEGTHWFNEIWKMTYGLKRSEWSGQQQQCDYGPVVPTVANQEATHDCFWDQGGFNYASDQTARHAIEWDVMFGVGWTHKLWVLSAGAVRLNQAYTVTPTEWGQSNTATFLDFSIYRKVPEINRYMEVYCGIGRTIFGRQGPAPLSMPSNVADGGADPRVTQSANHITLGANFNFGETH
jgi:hypothetical protein